MTRFGKDNDMCFSLVVPAEVRINSRRFPWRLSTALLVILAAAPATAIAMPHEGHRTILVMRVDFADLPGEPLSETQAIEAMRGASRFFEANSGGKFSLQATVTPVLRLPATGDLDSLVREAAKAAGFDPARFDFDAATYRNSPMAIALRGVRVNGGVAAINGKGLITNESFDPYLLVHELGHNLDVPHAGLWETTDGSVIGAGVMQDTGNPFDRMGSGPSPITSHYNSSFKNKLGWLGKDAVLDVQSSGIYHLRAHDFQNASGLRALKIRRDAEKNYWLEWRRAVPENAYLQNGALVHWTYNNRANCDLLDMTPDSPQGAQDAPLVVGRTFSDFEAGIHVTPISITPSTAPSLAAPGHSALDNGPDAATLDLDMAVNLGHFPDNHPPTLTINSSVGATEPGKAIVFSSRAFDPDGDTLSYYWDFGDSSWSGGLNATTSQSWNKTGDFVVRCTVSDRKGGTASDSTIVRVRRSGLIEAERFRISGRVTLNGQPLPDVAIGISASQRVWTDSDGTYTLPSLPYGSYTLVAGKWGFSFSTNFVNPMFLNANTFHKDFVAKSALPVVPRLNLPSR